MIQVKETPKVNKTLPLNLVPFNVQVKRHAFPTYLSKLQTLISGHGMKDNRPMEGHWFVPERNISLLLLVVW